jgi:long-chain acyl-CoA synthetase
VHDALDGENVRAYISWRPSVARPTMAELIQFSHTRVGYKAPDEIVVLDQIPINAAGKVEWWH